MSNDKTTLPDVQPGGRVRLGDADPMRIALEDALQFVETLHSTVSGDSRKIVWRCLERGRAALSAHPSPGGQDAPRCAEHCQNGFADICLASQRDGVICPEDSCDIDDGIRHNQLAARQPVGEPVTVEAVATVRRWSNGDRYIDWLTEGGKADLEVGDVLMVSDRAITDEDGSGEVYAAPPPQAVHHQAALVAEERAHGNTIDQRDRCEEVADELAARIASITGVDIGEHSSANCPWQNAIDAAEAYQPAQAVDLPYSLDADPAGIRARVADVITGTLMVAAQGHTPPPAGHWAEPFWQAARHDAARSLNVTLKLRELVAASQYMRDRVVETRGVKCMDDLDYAIDEAEKALIDSQAVGNG